jgi:hypothetical protein
MLTHDVATVLKNLLVRIRLDDAAIAMAREQGYDENNILPSGKRVQLVRTAHEPVIGKPRDVARPVIELHRTHPHTGGTACRTCIQ